MHRASKASEEHGRRDQWVPSTAGATGSQGGVCSQYGANACTLHSRDEVGGGYGVGCRLGSRVIEALHVFCAHTEVCVRARAYWQLALLHL